MWMVTFIQDKDKPVMMTPAFKKAFFCVLFSACAPWMAQAADFYQVRGGIPNSQYYFQANTVGNQYLFFIGNSVLAGAGLKDPNLRYSAQMVKGFKKHFPDAAMAETRHMQPGGSWFGLFRCSRGQPVFGEVICSGHLAILDFAADDRNADVEQVKTSLEGLVRQIILYRTTHSQILVYTLTPEMLQAYRAGTTPEYIRVSEQIAAHYGIPSLNLAQYAAEKIIAGEISFAAFSADGVNPTDAGARSTPRRWRLRRRADVRLSRSRQASAAHASPRPCLREPTTTAGSWPTKTSK